MRVVANPNCFDWGYPLPLAVVTRSGALGCHTFLPFLLRICNTCADRPSRKSDG